MKKRITAFAASVLCAAMMLAGCSGDTQKPADTTAAAGTSASPAASLEKVAKNESFTITKSTDAGNSGDVKLEPGDTYAVITVRDYGEIKVKLYPELVPYGVYNFVELAKKGTYNGFKFHRIVDDFMIQSSNGTGTGGSCIDGGNFSNEINTSLRHYYGALCYASSGAGEISDGFYIVNTKKPCSDLEALYQQTSQNYALQSMMSDYYLQSITPDMDNYELIHNFYTKSKSYNTKAAEAAQAMGETLTDAVTETYASKGGVASIDGAYTVFGQTVEGFDVIERISAAERVEGADGAISSPVTDIIIDKVEIFTA